MLFTVITGVLTEVQEAESVQLRDLQELNVVQEIHHGDLVEFAVEVPDRHLQFFLWGDHGKGLLHLQKLLQRLLRAQLGDIKVNMSLEIAAEVQEDNWDVITPQ